MYFRFFLSPHNPRGCLFKQSLVTALLLDQTEEKHCPAVWEIQCGDETRNVSDVGLRKVGFHPRTTKRFSSSRCVSTMQIVHPSTPRAETRPSSNLLYGSLSAMISQCFIPHSLLIEKSKIKLLVRARGEARKSKRPYECSFIKGNSLVTIL